MKKSHPRWPRTTHPALLFRGPLHKGWLLGPDQRSDAGPILPGPPVVSLGPSIDMGHGLNEATACTPRRASELGREVERKGISCGPQAELT
jgi:hypothetical protein